MSKSAPKAPDYTAAAEASGQSSRENTEAQTWANRPDQTTPWGTTSWSNTPTWDPSTQQYVNKWQQDTTLNEQSQRALDAQLGLTTGRSELAGSLFPRMGEEFGDARAEGADLPRGARRGGGRIAARRRRASAARRRRRTGASAPA